MIGKSLSRTSNAWKWALALLALAGAVRAQEPETALPLIASNITVLVEQGHGELDAAGSYTIRVYRREPGSLAPLEFVAGELRPRDGVIERTWLRDLDGDGQFEILVWIVSASELRYGLLEVFRLTSKGLKSQKFHGLTDREEEGYAGRDVYRLVGDLVEREFPLFADGAAAQKPTGQRRLLRYAMEEGKWRKKAEELKGVPSGISQ